jgi:hypothetical protein
LRCVLTSLNAFKFVLKRFNFFVLVIKDLGDCFYLTFLAWRHGLVACRLSLLLRCYVLQVCAQILDFLQFGLLWCDGFVGGDLGVDRSSPASGGGTTLGGHFESD